MHDTHLGISFASRRHTTYRLTVILLPAPINNDDYTNDNNYDVLALIISRTRTPTMHRRAVIESFRFCNLDKSPVGLHFYYGRRSEIWIRDRATSIHRSVAPSRLIIYNRGRR